MAVISFAVKEQMDTMKSLFAFEAFLAILDIAHARELFRPLLECQKKSDMPILDLHLIRE
jgi:hypothetical protein